MANWAGIRDAAAEGKALARRAGLFGEQNLKLLENIHLAGEIVRGDLPGLIRQSEEYLRGARVRGNVYGLAWPLSLLGYGRLLQGHVLEGRAALEEALELTPVEPLTVVRVHVELLSIMSFVEGGRVDEGLAHLEDLRSRWEVSGLVATSLENGMYRLVEARLLLLQAQRGSATASAGSWCCLSRGLQRILPAPVGIRDEMLRLEAAAAFHNGHPWQALKKLNRGLYLAEKRSNRFGLGLLYRARSSVRRHLQLPGAGMDRGRGERLLESCGASGCFLLDIEGWSDDPWGA